MGCAGQSVMRRDTSRRPATIELTTTQAALQLWSAIAQGLRQAGYKETGPEYLRLSKMLSRQHRAEILAGKTDEAAEWREIRDVAAEAVALLEPLTEAARLLADLGVGIAPIGESGALAAGRLNRQERPSEAEAAPGMANRRAPSDPAVTDAAALSDPVLVAPKGSDAPDGGAKPPADPAAPAAGATSARRNADGARAPRKRSAREKDKRRTQAAQSRRKSARRSAAAPVEDTETALKTADEASKASKASGKAAGNGKSARAASRKSKKSRTTVKTIKTARGSARKPADSGARDN